MLTAARELVTDVDPELPQVPGCVGGGAGVLVCLVPAGPGWPDITHHR